MNFKNLTQFLTGTLNREEVLKQAVKYPEVLREILNRLRAGEDDEGRLLLDLYADRLPSKFAARLRQHSADEARHARLLEEMLIRYGGQPRPIPGETFMTEFQHLSGRSREDLPSLEELLAALYEIEKRALQMMSLLIQAFEAGHPVRVLLESIRRDEERHVRWVEDSLNYLASLGPNFAKEIALLRKRYAAIDKAAFIAMTGTRFQRIKAIYEIVETFPPEFHTQYLLHHIPRAIIGADVVRRRLMVMRFLFVLQRKYHGVPPEPSLPLAA